MSFLYIILILNIAQRTLIIYGRFLCVCEDTLMLGKLIRLDITEPVGTASPDGFIYRLNQGIPTKKFNISSPITGVLVLGIDSPVKHFDGRVIATLVFEDNGEQKLIASPKSKRLIDCEIRDKIQFIIRNRPYTLNCYYERSCGAVIYRIINNEVRYLLIKNRRSSNWSFPKGHMEDGETAEQTAKREVLEETGMRIRIIDGFSSNSRYTIQNRIQKTVQIFVANTDDTQTKIQHEEIEDYTWLPYERALNGLKFDNDKTILTEARAFLLERNIIKE